MKYLLAFLLLPLVLAACDPKEIETACMQATELEATAQATLVEYQVKFPDDPIPPAVIRAWESAKTTKATLCSPAVQAVIASVDH